jgi:hypothetical protein
LVLLLVLVGCHRTTVGAMPRLGVATPSNSADTPGLGYGIGVSAGYKITKSAAVGFLLDATRSHHLTIEPPFTADYWAAQWAVFGRYRFGVPLPLFSGVTLMAWGFPFYVGERNVGGRTTRWLSGPSMSAAVLFRLPLMEIGPYAQFGSFRGYEQSNTGSPSIPIRYTSVGLAAQVSF